MKSFHRTNTPPPSPAEAERLRRLVAEFMAGATDRTQEREIHAFYATYGTGTLPPGLEQYRPMFAWYAGLEKVSDTPRRHPRRKLWTALGAAAALAALVVAGAGLMRTPDRAEQLECGYTIRDGQRYPLTTSQKNKMVQSERLLDSLTNDSLIFEAATTGVNDSESSEIIRNILSE